MQSNKNCNKKGKEGWVLAALIIFGFLFISAAQMVIAQISTVSSDWNEYRCNPLFMPIAKLFGQDPETNFANCMQTTQGGLMDGFLAPIKFLITIITGATGSLSTGLQGVRGAVGNMRSSIGGILGNFAAFLTNFVIAIQKMMISVKDIIVKISATVQVFIHMINTQMYLGKSIIDGPIGGVIDLLCFDPDTPVKLKNGSCKKMKKIKTGEILFNGQEVLATMKIKGDNQTILYKIFSESLNEYIYVTGSHLIQDKSSGRFIHVKKHKKSAKTNIIPKKLSCLVTDNHLIPIGEHIFWDWED